MTKHDGTYYLQYAAPGTQWNIYADGVYTSDDPLGPYEYAPYNPISYKPGGFLTGAGHGSTVQANSGNYWHFSTMLVSVNYKYERRIGMFPAGFEKDGQMFVNTAYGDYPHYAPGVTVDHHQNRFTGWMLLSKDKAVTANSVLAGVEHQTVDPSSDMKLALEEPDYSIENITDENVRTFWVAENNSDTLFFRMDLGSEMTVHALQINFMDFNAKIFGRKPGIKQQFIIESSRDGENWKTIVDRSQSEEDRPNCYHELDRPESVRYLRFQNRHYHNRYLAISDFRVFGKGRGEPPATPERFDVKRQTDQRNADIRWQAVEGATGYVLYWGIRPDRLNNSVMVYDEKAYALRALNVGQDYHFAIEAFNENGISERTEVVKN